MSNSSVFINSIHIDRIGQAIVFGQKITVSGQTVEGPSIGLQISELSIQQQSDLNIFITDMAAIAQQQIGVPVIS